MQFFSSSQSLNGALETWFMQNIVLGGAPVSLKDRPNPFAEDAIAYLELFEIDKAFITHVHNANKKMVLLHMGDELGNKDVSAYPACDLILRNYYFPELFHQPALANKIIWIPNGFRTGVGPRPASFLQTVNQRQHLASFMGWVQNPNSFAGERESFSRMIKGIRKEKKTRLPIFKQWLTKRLHPCGERKMFSKVALESEDLYLLTSGNFSQGNNVGLYSAIMENSIFAPCPAGNSPETIRLYDALECGCIPISLAHDFIRSDLALGALGPVPFVILSSWEELPDFLLAMKTRLQTNPQAILEQQKACITWWTSYKKQLQERIRERIQAL